MSDPFFIDPQPSTPVQNIPTPGPRIGRDDPVDHGGKYKDVGLDTEIVTDYSMRSQYEWDAHIYMAGVTSPNGFAGQSAAFFQLAAPTLLRISQWTGCQFHSHPDIPNPTPDDSDWVLLDVVPSLSMITVGVDSQEPLYRLTGTYVYGHKNPNSNVFEEVSFPLPPYLQNAFSRGVDNAKLQKGLLEGRGVSTGNEASPGFPSRNQ